MPQDRIKLIPITIFDTAGLTNAYQPLNPDGLPNACSVINIVNRSNKNIDISWDGITQHDIAFANGSGTIVSMFNAQPLNWKCLVAKGTKIYVKCPTGAGTGLVYLTGTYEE